MVQKTLYYTLELSFYTSQSAVIVQEHQAIVILVRYVMLQYKCP